LARIIDAWAVEIHEVWIETVSARPGEGVASSFNFGRSYGSLRATCTANFLKVRECSPRSWKRSMGLAADKEASRQRASAEFPRFAHLWALKKHHGRAEAALIALYGSRGGRNGHE